MQNRIIDIKVNALEDAAFEAILPLATIKSELVINHDEDNGILTRLRKAVIVAFQEYTKNVFYPETVVKVWANVNNSCFRIPRIPVIEITSVSLKTAPNTYEVLATDQYELIGDELLLEKTGILLVEYTAGYEELPANLQEAILSEITYRYENRNDVQQTQEFAGKAEAYLTPFIYRAYP